MFRPFGESTPEQLLQVAIRKNNIDSVKNILGEHPQLLNEPIGSGLSLLHYATLYGKTQMLADLLAMGCDPDKQTENSGCTALHIAVINAEFEKVCILLPVTSYSIKNEKGETILQAVENRLEKEKKIEVVYLESIHRQWGSEQENWPSPKSYGYGSQCDPSELNDIALLNESRDKIAVLEKMMELFMEYHNLYDERFREICGVLNQCTLFDANIITFLMSFIPMPDGYYDLQPRAFDVIQPI